MLRIQKRTIYSQQEESIQCLYETNGAYQYQIISQQPKKDDLSGVFNSLQQSLLELLSKQTNVKNRLESFQAQVRQLYQNLNQRKKYLVNLCILEHNQMTMDIDISILQQFSQMVSRISCQKKRLEQLHSLTSNSNKENILTEKQYQQYVQQIEVAKRFRSSQYVRQVQNNVRSYQILYEEAKYEYETKQQYINYLKQQKAQRTQKQRSINLSVQKQLKNLNSLQEQADERGQFSY